MKNTIIIISLLCFLFNVSIWGQSCNEADELFNNGRYSESINKYNLCLLGEETSQAFETFILFQIRKAKDCITLHQISEKYIEQKEWNKAKDYLKSIVGINPNDINANNSLKLCIEKTDNSNNGMVDLSERMIDVLLNGITQISKSQDSIISKLSEFDKKNTIADSQNKEKNRVRDSLNINILELNKSYESNMQQLVELLTKPPTDDCALKPQLGELTTNQPTDDFGFYSIKSQNGQFLIFKSNLLHGVTTSLNLGIELRTGHSTSFDFPVSYKPWAFSDYNQWRHILIQPEFRLWTDHTFKGHFFGLHGHFAHYDVGRCNPPFSEDMNIRGFRGWLAGGGLSYGYRWNFNHRWGLEATIGVGYAYLSYDKLSYGMCDVCLQIHRLFESEAKSDYFGPTKAGLTFIFCIGGKRKSM